MSEQGRGTFSCRIDGRAGYLRLFDDRIELIRSGRRGPEALGAEIFPMHQVTRVSTGKSGRMFTAVELVVAGGFLELRLPSIDAPRVADLIELLMRAAVVPDPVAPVVDPVVAPGPEVAGGPGAAPGPEVAGGPGVARGREIAAAAVAEADLADEAPPESVPVPVAPAPAGVVSAFVVPAGPPEEGRAFELSTIHIPELVVPEVLMPEWRSVAETGELLPELGTLPAFDIPKVEMPEWTPLPETELPELVLSQLVLDELAPAIPAPAEPVEPPEPVTAIAPLPEGSVLAAAAALAELEDMLSEIGEVVAGPVAHLVDPEDDLVAKARDILAPIQGGNDGPAQPSEAVLTLAAAALLGGARREAEASTTPPAPKRPEKLSPHLTKRLSRLEVLRSCGIMSEADYTRFEAEIFELAWAESKSA